MHTLVWMQSAWWIRTEKNTESTCISERQMAKHPYFVCASTRSTVLRYKSLTLHYWAQVMLQNHLDNAWDWNMRKYTGLEQCQPWWGILELTMSIFQMLIVYLIVGEVGICWRTTYTSVLAYKIFFQNDLNTVEKATNMKQSVQLQLDCVHNEDHATVLEDVCVSTLYLHWYFLGKDRYVNDSNGSRRNDYVTIFLQLLNHFNSKSAWCSLQDFLLEIILGRRTSSPCIAF